MEPPKKKPAPIVANEAERLREEVLQIEAEAQLADERQILEEMREKDRSASDTLADIRARIDRMKDKDGWNVEQEDG